MKGVCVSCYKIANVDKRHHLCKACREDMGYWTKKQQGGKRTMAKHYVKPYYRKVKGRKTKKKVKGHYSK